MIELRARLGLYSRQWRLKTIKTKEGEWFSREAIGQLVYDYMAKHSEWEPWAGKITGMILESEDKVLQAIMASRDILDHNVIRAREVLKQEGYILLTKKDGTQYIMQELRADCG